MLRNTLAGVYAYKIVKVLCKLMMHHKLDLNNSKFYKDRTQFNEFYFFGSISRI